ncbi:MAG: tetratricopeptide (TPR) repeat protein [Chlamydiales bacterium]
MDFSKHIQKADEALRRRNHDFAIQLYQQLIEIDADQGEARAGLRRALRARHESKGGGRLFRLLKGAGPLAVAKTLAKAGKHDAAAKSLETYLASNPLDEDANLLLGISLEAAGHYDSALAVFEFVAEIAPKSPAGLRRAGAMMQRKGEHALALAYYERALESDPRDREALKARKDLAAEAALTDARYESVEHSREQIRDKDEARRLDRTTRLHRSEEDLREELSGLESSLAESPGDADLMVQLSGLHERLKDPEAALELIECALEYRKGAPELFEARAGLKAKVLKLAIRKADKAGQSDEADSLERDLRTFELDDLARRIEVSPADGTLRLQLGRGLVRAEDHDGAAAQFQKAAADPRCHDEALFHLGHCFQRKGFLDLARKNFLEVLATRPDVDERAREILYNLGTIAEAEDDSAEARSFYARIYEVDIGFRDVAAKMEQLR